MVDPRVTRLAQVLVRYSLQLRPGDLFRINGNAVTAPLVQELYREALLAGAHPFTNITLSGLDEVFYRYGSDAQLGYIPDLKYQEIEQIEQRMAAIETELSDAGLFSRDPERFNALSLEHEALGQDKAAKEERWLELEMLREEMEG